MSECAAVDLDLLPVALESRRNSRVRVRLYNNNKQPTGLDLVLQVQLIAK